MQKLIRNFKMGHQSTVIVIAPWQQILFTVMVDDDFWNTWF